MITVLKQEFMMAAPSKGERAKRHIITMRVTGERRDAIAAAAAVGGRSISQEIEERLKSSFLIDDLFGGSSATARLLRAIAYAIDAAEGRVGARWDQDFLAWVAAKAAVEDVLAANAPDAETVSTVAAMADDDERAFERARKIESRMRALLRARAEFNAGSLPEGLKSESMELAAEAQEAMAELIKSGERIKPVRDAISRAAEIGEEAATEAMRIIPQRRKVTEPSKG